VHVDYSGRADRPQPSKSVLMYRGSEHTVPNFNCQLNAEQPNRSQLVGQWKKLYLDSTKARASDLSFNIASIDIQGNLGRTTGSTVSYQDKYPNFLL